MSRDIQTNWGKPSEARITAPAAAADVDVIASVGMNLTPECWDPDLLAILGSTWWDPDLLVTDLDPEKDLDPPGDPDLLW